MRKITLYSTRVYPRDLGSISRFEIGQIRGLTAEFGRPGIEAKRGQTNLEFDRRGYLRFVWKERATAIAFQRVVRKYWGAIVTVRRFRRRPK